MMRFTFEHGADQESQSVGCSHAVQTRVCTTWVPARLCVNKCAPGKEIRALPKQKRCTAARLHCATRELHERCAVLSATPMAHSRPVSLAAARVPVGPSKSLATLGAIPPGMLAPAWITWMRGRYLYRYHRDSAF